MTPEKEKLFDNPTIVIDTTYTTLVIERFTLGPGGLRTPLTHEVKDLVGRAPFLISNLPFDSTSFPANITVHAIVGRKLYLEHHGEHIVSSCFSLTNTLADGSSGTIEVHLG